MTSAQRILIASAFLLPACGGSSSSDESAATETAGGEHAHGEHHGEHHDHHAALPAEVNALHDELAPVWHQEPGATREAGACEHAASFRTHTTAVQGAAAPAGADAERWSTATTNLSTTVDALGAACVAGAGVDAAFEAYHTAFHGVMEAAGG
jgi:hypothetical protein